MDKAEALQVPVTHPSCSDAVKNVDRTLAKIKAATFRVGFNLWDIFKDSDEHKTNFISESKFLTIMMGPLKNIIGLDNSEIDELTTYLKSKDGRIAYTQLCKLVHETESPHIETEEDAFRANPLQSNHLSPEEEESILDILTRIAIAVPRRKMLLKPFFQDFELIRRGSGQVSRKTFAKVLEFIGYEFSQDEFLLLFKKYRYDAFTVKFNAFLRDLEEVRVWLDKHGYVDPDGMVRCEKLGPTPTLPKPELRAAPRGKEHGIAKIWDPDWPGKALASQTAAAFNKVKEQVRKERLRVQDYFQGQDECDSGRVPRMVFQRCLLDWICPSQTSFNNLYLSPREVELLVTVYLDRDLRDRVLWKVFMDDLEEGVDERELECWPRREGDRRRPLDPYQTLYRPPSPPLPQDSTLEQTLEHIRNSMEARPESKRLVSVITKKDREGFGWMETKKFDWSFIECGIYLSQTEKESLYKAYLGEAGVNWRAFIKDLHAHVESVNETMKRKELEHAKMESQEQDRIMAEMAESNIVDVLAKIKRHVICKRVWMRDFLKEFDKKRSGLVSKEDFLRGLDHCGIRLTKTETATLLDVFSLPKDSAEGRAATQTEELPVEYERFCRTVDEESLPPCHTRPQLKEAMALEEAKQVTPLPVHQFANYRERQVLAAAMDKLVSHVSLANKNFFMSLDKEQKGSVSRLEFQRALWKLGCLHLFSAQELEAMVHCFGIKDGLDLRLDYISLLNALDIVFRTRKAASAL